LIDSIFQSYINATDNIKQLVKIDNSYKISEFHKYDELNTSMNKLNFSVFTNKILSKKLNCISDFNLNGFIKNTT